MKPTSIFIPAYNAEKHIESVIKRIPRDLWDDIVSVWIIDDGSKDATWRIISGISSNIPKIKPVRFEQNRGYGGVAKHALSLCAQDGCAIAVCLHSDGQYPPEHITELAEKMAKENLDILQGSRMLSGTALAGGMPLYRFWANRLGTFLENLAFGLDLTDYHSGFLFYSRRAMASIPFNKLSNSFDFDVEAIVCAKILGLKVGEGPIPTRYADEKCYLNPIDYSLRIVGIIFRYLAGKYRKICARP